MNAEAVGAPDLDSLLVKVGNADLGAFRALYATVAGMVYGVARRVIHDPARSEELAQEVLVEVWKKAPSYDPGKGSAQAWIATIAHRRAVDLVRAEEAARRRQDLVAATEGAVSFDSTYESIETTIERDSVRAALDRLTELQREVIELAYYQGNTYRQVADIVDAPVGTVKTRIRDGLLSLRRILDAPDE